MRGEEYIQRDYAKLKMYSWDDDDEVDHSWNDVFDCPQSAIDHMMEQAYNRIDD